MTAIVEDARHPVAAKPPPPRVMPGSGLPLWLAVGHFMARAPRRMARTQLPRFLARLADQPRSGADYRRIARLTRRWLRVPGMGSRDTCYLRSLVLFRFLDPGGGDLRLHFGVDEPKEGERLHGHAWVSLDGRALNPPGSMAEGRLREIYWYSTLRGGASADGASLAVAMMQSPGEDPANGRPSPA